MSDAMNVFTELKTAFEEFKRTNDERIETLEKGNGQAGELEGKLVKIEAELKRLDDEKSALEAKLNRPGLPGVPGDDPVKAEHREAFRNFLRKGADSGLADLQLKAVQIGVEGDGGYAVPETLSQMIYELAQPLTPMRDVCSVFTVGNEEYKQLVDVGGTAARWVGETDARTETATPQLKEVKPVFGELTASPRATQKSLDDIFFNVEDWLTASVARAFAQKENEAFTVGTGTNQPKGFLAYPSATTGDDTRAFGTLQYLATGVAADFPALNPSDLLIDVVHALKSGYRMGARWMMNGPTLAKIRKWKDNDHNYLWQPGLQAGIPNMILGYPYTENEDMPSVGANALCLAFGNFNEGYQIVDRMGIRMLRDPYVAKPYVEFYTTKRVGGMLLNSEAIKLVKCEA